MEINWMEVWTQTSVPAVSLLGAFKSQLGDTSYCVFCCCFIALPSDNQTSTWGLLVGTVIAICQYRWFVLTLFRVCSQLAPVHTENSYWLSFESGHHLAPVRFYWSVFARTMHSTSEFAKMFLSKCVLYSTLYIYIYIGSKQSPNSHDEALVQAGLLHPGRAVAGWFPATARPSRLKSFTMSIAYGWKCM